MIIPILILAAIVFVSWRLAPRESQESAHVHGAGQIGLLAAIALFGVDYFTSFYYATGEMMSALHPYGLEEYAFVPVVVVIVANFVFGALYMYSLGVFRDGGGSFTAAMRYLGPSLSLIVAVVLVQDYVFTIVVSTLSGADQLLSLWNAQGMNWIYNFGIGALLVGVTWFITIRGRGESAQVVFTLLGVFFMLTVLMFLGLLIAQARGVPPAPPEAPAKEVGSIAEALYHMLTASMKGLVALTGLEAMSNGIQFLIDDDPGFVKWGRKHLPRLHRIWDFYSGKSGIGRAVQTSFLFYGGLTTLLLTIFAIQFNVWDGTMGRSLVANLAAIGFDFIPNGQVLFWAYQILAVLLLSAASMTAYQDMQAITWRNVAIGEIPEIVVYRNMKGTFTRPVTAAAITAIIIQFLVQGRTSLAVPYYGIGVFLPITAMGLAIRRHVLLNYTGRKRLWGGAAATFSVALSTFIFMGQIVGKWEEGGWVVLIVLIALIIMAHIILISPAGYRDPKQIHRIVREKSRVYGPMGNIVEWQSLSVQEYRYRLLHSIARFWELFGVRKPLRFEPDMPPVAAGSYEDALHVQETGHKTLLDQYLESQPKPEPRLGGPPKETGAPMNS
ncbi:MAG: amino acid permease [Anaerolineae bacterium]|nr:APC family permease [Thermoflexales bacterium]MDW8406550.1 amino acid permease [Anaerolineae bacterium]